MTVRKKEVLREVLTSPNEWARAPRLRSHTDTLPLSVPRAIIPREVGLDAPELPRFDCGACMYVHMYVCSVGGKSRVWQGR